MRYVARRLIIDIELAEDSEDQFFDYVADVAYSASANVDVSMGPAPEDACFPHPLRTDGLQQFRDRIENPSGCDCGPHSAEVIERIIAAATEPDVNPIVRPWTREELGLA